jgi:hypothetical protein
MKTLHKEIRGNARAIDTLASHGIKAETHKRHGCFATEVSGKTFSVRESLRAMGGEWLPASKSWLVNPDKFDAATLLRAFYNELFYPKAR